MTAKRKQKVSKACDSCKARKKKCDGTQPCPSCVVRGIACSYIIEDKRRTRYTASGFLDSSSVSVSPRLSHDLQKVQTSPITELKVNIAKIPSSLRPLLNLPANYHYDNNNGNNDNNSNIGKEDTMVPTMWNPDNAQKNLRQYDSVENLIPIEHTGPVSTLFLFRQVVSTYEPFSLQDTPFVNDIRRITNQSDVVIPFGGTPKTQLPSREYSDFVLNLFHQNLNQIIYTFRADYIKAEVVDKVYSDPNGVPKAKLCFFYFVLSVGTLFANALQKKDASLFPFDKIENPATFAQIGMHLLLECDCILSVEMIESLHLLTYYYLFSNAPYMLWTKLGTAIRYAEMMGLNKPRVNESYRDEKFAMHRQRLWRNLCVADCLLSPMIGRSISITEHDLQAIVKPLVQIRDFDEEVEYQVVKICVINARVVQTLYGGSGGRLKFVNFKDLAIAYHQWSKELPYEFGLNTFLVIDKIYNHATGFYKNTKYAYHPLYFIYFGKLFGVILLSKQCLSFMLIRRLHFLQSGNYHGVGILSRKSFIRNFADSCYNAAKFTVEFSHFFWERSMRPDKPFTYINCVFNAALIIGQVYYTQISQQNSHLTETKELHDDIGFLHEDNEILLLKLIKVLGNFAEVDTISERYFQVLSNLYNSIKDKDKSSDQDYQHHQLSKQYNVKREFELFLFPLIESYPDDSQGLDMELFNDFLSRYYNPNEDLIILHDTI